MTLTFDHLARIPGYPLKDLEDFVSVYPDGLFLHATLDEAAELAGAMAQRGVSLLRVPLSPEAKAQYRAGVASAWVRFATSARDDSADADDIDAAIADFNAAARPHRLLALRSDAAAGRGVSTTTTENP